ncbi:MAG: helix-turn-helix domain-containing protein [Eubacterium sp.]|nr:helix-turn-helix domain-containing protein [Eubacterium sp.]
MYDSKSISERLRKKRNELGLSRKAVAEDLSYSEDYVKKIEQGKKGPSFEYIFRFSEKYSVSLDFLCWGFQLDDTKLDTDIEDIESLLRNPRCPFVLYVGRKKLVKRKEFEKFISDNIEI